MPRARDHCDLVLCNSDLDPVRQMEYVQSLLEKRVDGILMNSVAALNPEEQKKLAECGVPIVLLNRSVASRAFSTVSADNEAGGVLAAQHLLELGHREIAHITGPRQHGNLSDRTRGFVETLAAGRRPVSPIVLHGAFNFEGGRDLTAKALDQHPDVTAIFAANDVMAFGAVRAILDRGMRIPRGRVADRVRQHRVLQHHSSASHYDSSTQIRDGAGRGGDSASPGARQNPADAGEPGSGRGTHREAILPEAIMTWSRRELLEAAGFVLAGPAWTAAAQAPANEWIRNNRTLIAEAYNPPFYPSLDYQPAKAVKIARELNADSLRYPAASYYAYFPTKSGYPVHPELKADIMRQTVEQCRARRA